MSNSELICANGSRERKTQGWFVTDSQAFEIGYDQARVVTLDSSKGRYDFGVCHPPATAGMACALVWRSDRWELEAKTEEFSFGTLPDGKMKLSCLF